MHVTFSFAFSSRFAKIRSSQRSAANTEIVVGIIRPYMGFDGNLILFPAVKELCNSVKSWQSYGQEFGVLLFCDSVYIESLFQLLHNVVDILTELSFV